MKRVLMLVEGEKTEVQLFSKLFELFKLHDIEIISYKTNIYAFYNRLKKDFADDDGNIDFDNIDLPLFLNDYLRLDEEHWFKDSDFSDKILVFDFDPQDPQFHKDILIELLHHFSNSTDLGKLYINYPMIESYADIESNDLEKFINSKILLEEVKRGAGKQNPYKSIVKGRSIFPPITKLTNEHVSIMIMFHLKKVHFIVNETLDYSLLCNKQMDQLLNHQSFFVVNTSLLYLQEEYRVLES